MGDCRNVLLFINIGLQIGLLVTAASGPSCDPKTEFACRGDSPSCIALSRVRDGSPDCPDGSDEECKIGEEFQCQTIHQCIPNERFHDGWPDCDDGSDEECSRGQHRCRCGLPHCIDGHRVKDGVKDCIDGSDEEDALNKTCPDENRLQDLMAMEKRRKKRQIDNPLEEGMKIEDNWKDYSSPSARMISDKYRKKQFPYIIQSKRLHLPTKELLDNTNSQRVSSRNAYRVGTETESYGSLVSGNIYQTAVSEPVSIIPTSTFTLIKFDHELPKKIIHKKTEQQMRKNLYSKQHLSDIMQKIVFLYQNDSQKFNERKKEGIAHRKLLSVTSKEGDFKNYRVKKSVSTVDISHIALASQLHTTGIILSTTGTDVMEGRTTAWTTIVEGTYVKGTYAHIIHSTSRIFFTVEKTKTTDFITPTSVSRIDELATPTFASSPIYETTDPVSISNEHSFSDIESEAFDGKPQVKPTPVLHSTLLNSETPDTSSSKKEFHLLDPSISVIEENTLIQMSSASNGDSLDALSKVFTESESIGTIASKNEMVQAEKDMSSNDSLIRGNIASNTEMTHLKKSIAPNNEMMKTDKPVTSNNKMMQTEKSIAPNNETVHSKEDALLQNIVGRMAKTESTIMDYGLKTNDSDSKTGLNLQTVKVLTDETRSNDHKDENILLETIASPPLPVEVFSSLKTLEDENLDSKSINDKYSSGKVLLNNSPIGESVSIPDSQTSTTVMNTPAEYDTSVISVTETTNSLSTSKITGSLPDDRNNIAIANTKSDSVSTASNLNLESSFGFTFETLVPQKVSDTPVFLMPSIESDTAHTSPPLESLNANPSPITTSADSNEPEAVSNEPESRKRRDVPTLVTVLNPEGRIISTDARVYLTPHYTTYTYFTTILKPGGGTQIQSSLEVETVYPSDRSDDDQPCCGGHVHGDGREGVYVTHYPKIPSTHDHHIETVPYDLERASEITHRTTYTYYTTRFRGGTSFVETRKETETNVTPIPSAGRYSPFEIGTYYEPDDEELHPHHTEAPHIVGPHDMTHRTTYTYFTTRFRNGSPIVETRRETDTNVTPIPTIHRHGGVLYTQNERFPVYSQPIDPNLYKPDRVTHRTTYTYHTTRFRDGVPIVNTRKETETNVTPIPTYTRSTPLQRTRLIPSRVITRPVERTAISYDDHPHHDHYDPYITHRTTYTYYTTKLRGGDVHVDTRYVTETNLTPNPALPVNHGVTTLYNRPHYDDFNVDQCPSCRGQGRTRVPPPSDRTVVLGHDRVVRPSTATHLTTYTYATTTLARGDLPVVRTREHTVTEVYSDVVLPTLKFGDRIRAKRDDGRNIRLANRQDRRIAYDDVREPQNVPDSKRFQKNDSHKITPTRITYYSTFTYFTTELGGSVPIVRTREHTVTEILSDVIVPTVRNPISRTTHSRAKRNLVETHSRKLLSVAADEEETTSSNITTAATGNATNSLSDVERNTDRSFTNLNTILNTPVESVANTVNDTVISTESSHLKEFPNILINQPESTTFTIYDAEINTDSSFINFNMFFNISSTQPESVTNKVNDSAISTESSDSKEFPSILMDQPENTTISISDTEMNNGGTLSNSKEQALFNTPSTPFETNTTEGFKILNFEGLTLSNAPIAENEESIPGMTQNETVKITAVTEPTTVEGFNETIVYPSDILVSSIETLTHSINTVSSNLKTDMESKNSAKSLNTIGNFEQKTPHLQVSSSAMTDRLKTETSENNSVSADLISSQSIDRKLSHSWTRNQSADTDPSKLSPTETYKFSPKLDDIDLTADGAEMIYSSRAPPSTYFTTYTYYATILRPGGQREIETKTKVVSSTLYDPAYAPAHQKSENMLRAKEGRKCCDSEFIRPTRAYDLRADSAVVRTYSAIPNYRSNQPYKPSFADKVRGPFYDTPTKSDCPSCNYRRRNNYNNDFRNKKPDQYIARTPYLTSIPVFNPATYKKLPEKTTNAVFYPGEGITPTAVTFYSTYTYFTTELKEGSPYIRSREHTVTEILTDVIVPTVSRVLHQSSASPYRRNKRHINEKLFKRKLKNFFKRKLLRSNEEDSVANNSNDLNFLNRHERAIPITHYTTHTYYKTSLKPGNKKEIESSTKIISSVYYNKIQPTGTLKAYNTPSARRDTIRRQEQQNQNSASRFQKPYYLLPTQRRLNVTPHHGLNKNDKIKPNFLKDYEKKHNVMETHIPMQPSMVTFYSTYTYFTTELAGGHPVIKSREHTVTEILSDVIVPTVVKLRRSESIHSTPVQQNRVAKTAENSFFHRKLLSLNDSLDLEAKMNDAYYENETNEEKASEDNLNDLKKNKFNNFSRTENSSTKFEDDAFLNSAQYSKAYAAYLKYLQSSNFKISKQEDRTNFEILNLVSQPDSTFKSSITHKYSVPKVTATVSASSSESQNEEIILFATSTVKRNGRMTKYTTTIYGTYVNGVYAQRAKSNSDIVPMTTDIDISVTAPLQPITPSRLSGLVQSVVSRKVRGPVAVHLTTEIHGVFIGNAYAQTARVFTSSQPLSSTREPFSFKLAPIAATSTSGVRKTGLLSSRIVRSKIEGSTTLLFVSEIYGTHIGGAYAHLGTYTTRTITPSSTSSIEPSSTSLSTFHIDDLTTGLVTASVSDRIMNATTIRYHFEVYGTYLDGTYAHVPSISTETLQVPNYLTLQSNSSIITNSLSIPDKSLKIEFMEEASTGEEVINGARDIFEKFNDRKMKENTANISPTPKFEILSIFSTNVIVSSTHAESNANSSSFAEANSADLSKKEVGFDVEFPEEHFLYENLLSSTFPHQMTPILLPEALRTSFSPDTLHHLQKRSYPDIQSSFLDSTASRRKPYDCSHSIMTNPLPDSDFTEPFATSSHFKSDLSKSKHQMRLNINKTTIFKKRKNTKHVVPIKEQDPSSRKKRSASRSLNRRFGSTPTSSTSFRRFGSTNTASTTRGFRSSARSSATYSKPSKSLPSFLSRGLRSSSTSRLSTSSIKPTSSSSYKSLMGRTHKFGKKEPEEVLKDDDVDFDASEALTDLVTEETFQSKPLPKFRLNRPSKVQKNNHSSLKADRSRSKSRIMSIRTSSTLNRFRSSTKNNYISSNKRKTNSRPPSSREVTPTMTDTPDSTSSKRRFTLTTTFSLSLNPTASFLLSNEGDSEILNNVQEDTSVKKRKNRKHNSNSNFGSLRKSNFQAGFENEENEVQPRVLPLPVFGRSRGTTRPPKFDPRTIKSSATSTTTQFSSDPDIQPTPVFFDSSTSQELVGPITVTEKFTTTKTLPVHLGLRTSFATITTTGYSTSTIQTEDLTKYTIGGITKTLLSAVTNFPDANLPPDQQFTVVTEILLTTTTIETTSLVAIKMGYGTRTENIVNRQIMTILATQTNTLLEDKTPLSQIPPQYPYFPNPFAPSVQNNGFSLSLSENSFVSTQTVTSTTVLPIFLNGKSILTTLTSTTLSETTLVKTATVKVPQLPTAHPFVFPQPVFILPSVTTDVTVRFTAPDGEVFSIVTTITVPLAINGHTRFARSIHDINSTQVLDISETNFIRPSVAPYFKEREDDDSLPVEFPSHLKNTPSQSSFPDESKIINNERLSPHNSKQLQRNEYVKDELHIRNPLELTSLDSVTFKSRKLLQVDDTEDDAGENAYREPYTESEPPTDAYRVDTFHITGPRFNDDRPIPSVRVIPTRRAYIRRIKPETSRNQPMDRLSDEYYARSNLQNFPRNVPDSDFYPGRRFPNENFGSVRGYPNNMILPPPQDFPVVNNFAPIRGAQYFSPNRPNSPFEPPFTGSENIRPPQNFEAVRTNRPADTFGRVRNPSSIPTTESGLRAQADGFDTLRHLPSYSPTRESVRGNGENADDSVPTTTASEESRDEPETTSSPRRVIRLRRPGGVQLNRSPPPPPRQNLNRKPIINSLAEIEDTSDSKNGRTRARGPAITTHNDERRPNRIRGNDITSPQPSNVAALPLTYYTTFTYMTTFLNGPSTAYSTREAVVSNVATETLNPHIVGLIRTRGGFTSQTGIPTAVPLGSTAKGATTTIVNLASRVQLYNSDVYYGRSTLPENNHYENSFSNSISSSTVQVSDIATLPKTYYTLFTYYYTLKDNDKSTHSQRSETLSNIDSQTEPFVTQDFSSTIDGNGILTLKPDKKIVNLGLRTAQGTTTEVNLELQTLVKFDNVRNAVVERGSITPTLVEIMPSETDAVYNNYLEPGDAEVQDQQTYPQTVAIQPSFSSSVGSQKLSSSDQSTPEIPGSSRLLRTQSLRGPLRIATTVLQRPGNLRTFVPRPGVRVRVKPLNSADSSPETDDDDSATSPDITTEEMGDDESSTESDIESVTESGSQEFGGRKRLKITIRRSPGAVSRTTRTRPRFYVVTKTAERGSQRASKRPVKISRIPTSEMTMTSVPVVFGLSTTYRNALVTSLDTPEEMSVQPSKTVIFTYFTTTTYTVPYTVDGKSTFTTLEETNSRYVTETLEPDADLSFITTPTLNEEALLTSSFSNVRQPAQTLKPQLVNNQLSIGPRVNLITKISNGVSLIVASDGDMAQPTLTLSPTMVTDALRMMDKDKTTVYEPRTLLTTFTFFTTFFNEGTPSISTSEQVVTNVYSVPVTMPNALKPVTVTETSENLVSTTYYSTHTFYATLFNGTETVVTPLEELQSSVVSSTETYTITKTIIPTEMKTTEPPQLSTTSLYRTVTNFVTLFRGSESIVSPLEEIATDVITLTLDKSPPPSVEALYTTRTIQATNTHYITLFSGGESILSSITEVAPSVITELVKQQQQPGVTISASSTMDESTKTVEPTFQDLVPSIRTQYTTLTYFTTLFTDSSTILSSREEIATSYITLFVPASLTVSDEYTRQTSSQRDDIKSSSTEDKISPSSEILTFYTTYTYYTTLFRGTETIISDSETVVTQYVTIESTPTESAYRPSTTTPPTLLRSSDSVEIRVEPTTTTTASTQNESTSSATNVDFDDDIQIIGIETKVQSESPPSIITGIPSTDSNGATHILFTDFIVPSDEDSRPPSSTKSTPHLETSFFPNESQTPSSARDSASDYATTRLTDVATHHAAVHPTTTYQSGSSQTLGIKPGAVIDLSDVLTNTNLVGNLGETIKDIVNLFAANGNKQRINSTKQIENNDSPLAPPVGGATVSNIEEPIYIPIGAIGRNTKPSVKPSLSSAGGILRPSTLITGFTPIVNYEEAGGDKPATEIRLLSSVVIGTDTILINHTGTAFPETLYISESDGRFVGSHDPSLQGSVSKHENDDRNKMSTPGIESGESTSIITGLETIFFGFPDARKPPPQTTTLLQGSISTSSVVGVETIFFDSPDDLYARGPSRVNISGATTIFGTFPPISETTENKNTETLSSVGETTIFFPVPGDSPEHSHPGTRYVTSVESVTLTLTLTTSNVHQTEGTFVTDTSVFTTTIPPRTYVSTIIGSRTILGTQPEPTEALQVIPTMQPSESTTTVTTTTLIFNSIATTVVRTLVIPTHGVQPTRPATGTSTDSPRLAGILTFNQRPKVTTEKSTTTRKTIQLFKSGNRPTEPTTSKPGRTGPPLKLFPTKPPTTTTQKPPKTSTKESTTFRKPGKTLVPITDGCPRECNLKNKEVCKQNIDKSWSCQCRPGFFKKDGSQECRDVKSYVVLVRVLKMGGNEVSYLPELENSLSPEYQNLTTTARKAVDDAYKTSNVRDHYVSTNVIGVGRKEGGVFVNLTVQLSGEKPTNEEFLKEELAQSLEFAASEIELVNATTLVSPIIQRVEDVQDFDECSDDIYNDCSRSSVCVNLPGSYSCECKEGYQDLEPLLPGRICSGEIKDCDYCNNRGICIMTEDDNKFCRCYRMYLGKQCEINGLVLAIALPIALALLILMMFCLLCGCRKLREKRSQKPKPNNVFKGMVPPTAGTLDRKAMIMDSSSESSGEHRPHHAYNAGFEEDLTNSTMKRSRRSEMMEDRMSEFQVPTVLIPRAKHSHPKQVTQPYPNYRMPPEMDRW
ncbi:mucin-3B [Parasteatoda tepidariorum]